MSNLQNLNKTISSKDDLLVPPSFITIVHDQKLVKPATIFLAIKMSDKNNRGRFSMEELDVDWIMGTVGMKDLRTVGKHLKKLLELGWIKFDSGYIVILSWKKIIGSQNRSRLVFKKPQLAHHNELFFSGLIKELTRKRQAAVRIRKVSEKNMARPYAYAAHALSNRFLEKKIKYSHVMIHKLIQRGINCGLIIQDRKYLVTGFDKCTAKSYNERNPDSHTFLHPFSGTYQTEKPQELYSTLGFSKKVNENNEHSI